MGNIARQPHKKNLGQFAIIFRAGHDNRRARLYNLASAMSGGQI